MVGASVKLVESGVEGVAVAESSPVLVTGEELPLPELGSLDTVPPPPTYPTSGFTPVNQTLHALTPPPDMKNQPPYTSSARSVSELTVFRWPAIARFRTM